MNPFAPQMLRGLARLGTGLLGLGLAIPLVVACWLEPSPAGFGTHQQLGLPPCSAMVLFGRPCPTCGMTTSWADVVRMRWRDALRANVGGALLCVLDAVAVPWLLASAAFGRWFGGRLPGLAATWSAVAVLVVTLVQWSWRLWIA